MHQHEEAIRAELAATAAFADLCAAAPPDLAETLRLQTRTFHTAFAACAPGWNTIHINRVFGVGLDQPASEALLDDVTALYTPAHVQFALNVSPLAAPPMLPTWLAARGFVLHSQTALLSRTAQAPASAHTDLHIRQIGRAEADAFAELLVRGFPLPAFFAGWLAATVGRPQWRHYLACAGATAVAAASLFIHEHTAVLNWSATLESHRRRGAQRALIHQRISDAVALGCTLLTSDTAEETPAAPNWSYRNLQRQGFRLRYLRPTYVSPAPGREWEE